MKQLNGLDGMFLALDSSATNGVLGGLITFDPAPDGSPGPDAGFMRARVTERLDAIPPMRWVRVRVPLWLDHDYLADASRVDVYSHINTIRLPSPGTHDQLAAEVSRLMSSPLTPGRPMWDLWVIEGLEGGRMAHLLRIHHGVLDGGSMPLLWDLLSDDPQTKIDPAWAPTRRTEPAGGVVEMGLRGLVGTALRPPRLALLQARLTWWALTRVWEDAGTTMPAVMTRMAPGILSRPMADLLNIRQRLAGKPEIVPLIPRLRGPVTPFNQKVTSARVFTYTDFPLAEMKAAGKPFGMTLNDVVVAMCAGAVRRFLTDLDALPDEPLIVCVPVGLRDPKAPFRWGNEVSMMFTELPTHLSDPVERLNFARESVRKAKANFDQMPVEHLERAAVFMPEAAFAVPTKVMAAAPGWLVPSPASWNVVVSNVRGPSAPAYVAGTRVQGYWPASFLSPVGGVNITLQSYADRVDLGIVACKDHVENLDALTGYLHDELDTLMALAEAKKAQEAPVKAAEPVAPASGRTATAKSATDSPRAARPRRSSVGGTRTRTPKAAKPSSAPEAKDAPTGAATPAADTPSAAAPEVVDLRATAPARVEALSVEAGRLQPTNGQRSSNGTA